MESNAAQLLDTTESSASDLAAWDKHRGSTRHSSGQEYEQKNTAEERRIALLKARACDSERAESGAVHRQEKRYPKTGPSPARRMRASDSWSGKSRRIASRGEPFAVRNENSLHALSVIEDLMENSENDRVRLAAAEYLLDRALRLLLEADCRFQENSVRSNARTPLRRREGIRRLRNSDFPYRAALSISVPLQAGYTVAGP